jgi:hypothetical protein
LSTSNDHVQALIEDYLRDALPPAEAQRLEAHCAGCTVCQAALEEARQRHAGVPTALACDTSPERLVATLQRMEEQRRRRQRILRRVVLSCAVALLAGAAALVGMDRYYRSLRPTPANLLVYGHSWLRAGAPGSLRILLLDHAAKAPLVGVPVTVELHRGDEVVELALASTDAHGTAEPQFQVPDWTDDGCELLVRALLPTGVEQVHEKIDPKHPQNPTRVMLTTDSPVYQPGAVMEVRALALHSLDLHPVSAEAAVFTLRDRQFKLLFKEVVKTNRFGIAVTRYHLDQKIADGNYTLACTLGSTESRLGIEVKKDSRPKFRLSILPNRAYYAPNENATLTIAARALSGKPIAGAEVEVEVVTDVAPGPGAKPLTARTNDKGLAVLTCRVPDRLPEREEFHGGARITLRATVTDAAGPTQTQSVDRIVTTQPVRIEVIPEGKTLAFRVRNYVYVFVLAVDGSPVPGATVTIEGWSGSLQTDRRGLAVLVFSGTQRDWTFMAKDAAGKELARRNLRLDYGYPPGDFLLRTDRAVYDAGQALTLTALGGEEPIFVEFIKAGQLLQSETVLMRGGKGEAKVELPPGLSGTIEVRGIRINAEGYLRTRSRLLYVRPRRDLNIRATLDAAEYRPSGKAVVSFAVTDAAGKPAPAALSVVAVDRPAIVAAPLGQVGQEWKNFSLEEQLVDPMRTISPWSPEIHDTLLEEALFATTARGDIRDVPQMSSWGDKSRAVDRVKEAGDRIVDIGWIVFWSAAVLLVYLSLWFFARRNTCIILTVVCLLLVGTILALKSYLPQDYQYPPPKVVQGGQARRPEVRVETHRARDYLSETLLWKPELITDDQGRAHLEVPLGDSPAIWWLNASAVTADGRLGATQIPIKVVQP